MQNNLQISLPDLNLLIKFSLTVLFDSSFQAMNIYQLFQDAPPRELVDLYKMWLADGGSTTMKEFLEYDSEQQKKALRVLKDALLITE